MILLIAPLHDIPTSISTLAVNNLMEFLKKENIPYHFLGGATALRFPFNIYMLKDINFIIYFGHGREDALLGSHGFFGQMLDSLNANGTKEKLIYTMACLSSLKLNKYCREKGAIGYFGQTDYYSAAFPESDHNYLEDWINYTTIIPKLLVKGDTCLEALGKYKKIIDGYITDYNKNKYANYDWYLETTKSNMNNMTYIGDNVKYIKNKIVK